MKATKLIALSAIAAFMAVASSAFAGGVHAPPPAQHASGGDHHKVRCYSLNCGPEHPPGYGHDQTEQRAPGSYYGPDGTQYLTGHVPVDRPPCWTGAKPCAKEPK